MDWNLVDKGLRDLDFETRYYYDPSLNYDAEVSLLEGLKQANDIEGQQTFFAKHKGMIAFLGKVAYYRALKAAGALPLLLR